MSLPIEPPLPPMEARVADALPEGDGWQFEPKWDGFRCLAFRDAGRVELQSKAGRPLGRYFPDVVEAVRSVTASRFVLDGELVVPVGGGISFEALQLRLHPAASRVHRLAAEQPAAYAVFDLLVDDAGERLTQQPLAERRRRLERFASAVLERVPALLLSPATRDRATAQTWLARPRAGLDGVMAKRLDQPYRSGDRRAMEKVKPLRTADCVVAGFRRGASGDGVASLLLGLYDDAGALHHVGHTSSLSGAQRRALEPQVLRGAQRAEARGGGFSGRAPGAPSRWSHGRSSDWEPTDATLVVEVQYRHWSGGRFRHGTRLLRERPDKAARQCTFEQIPEALQGAA